MKKLIVLLLLCSCSKLAYAADNNYNPPNVYHQMSDDGYVSISLPFTFTFFNQPFTTSWMYDNGIISFKEPFTNGAVLPYTWWVPNPSDVNANYFIASLYADIAPKNGVTKYITQGDATSMKYIWQDIAEYYSLYSGGGVQNRYSTFSTTINSDGSIATHYTALNLQTSNVLAAVVGNISAGEITTFYSASYGAHITTGGISDWSVAGVPVYVPPIDPVPVYIIPISDPVDTSGGYIDPNNYNGPIDPYTYDNSTGMVITDTTTSPDPVSLPPPSTEPITLLLPPTPPPPSEPPPSSTTIGSAPVIVNGAPQSAAPGGAPITIEQSTAPPSAPLQIASPAAISPASLSPASSAAGKSSIDVMSISRAAVQKTNALENSVVGGSIDSSMQSATSSVDASSSVSSVTGGSTESASASSSSSSSSSQRSFSGPESSSLSQATQQTDSQSTSAASGTQSTAFAGGGPQTTATSTITSTIQAMDGNADNTQTSGVVNLTSAPEQVSSAPLINSKDIVKDGITVYNSTFEVDATETNTINSIIADSALKSPTLPEVTAVADETNPTSVRSLAATAASLNTQIEDQIDQDQKKVNEIVQKSSVDINELALGGIELAQFQVVPIGYNTYLTLVMKDAKFYDPKEVYRNQTVIDNAPILRRLNFASDSKFEKMVDQQYKAEQ